MKSDPCECECKCGRPKQPPGGPESDGRLCADCDSAACDLPPGPTWTEALAVIRRRDWQTANRLEKHRYLLYSRAWSVAHRIGVAYSDANRKISQSTALARIESQALDLYEQLTQDGDSPSVTAGHDG